ncbi:MAG: tandem-95 repeat protein [Propionicimonas sp.]|uniref:Ig-like domain-containing protein n=1 Tax=Propionicimonas sp. TaxID=1955623 RepID=UPI003D11D15D
MAHYGTRKAISALLALPLTLGLALSGPTTAATAATGDLVCGNGYVYAVRDGGANVTENGDLIRVNTSTGAASAIGNFASGTTVKLNALGISGDGGTAYAISDAASGSATVYTWKNATGATTSTPITGLNSSLVTIKAGAVDPSTGAYWLGAGVGSTSGEAFYLYKVDLSSGKAVLAATTTWLGKNADMAFDAKGNLYLAVSSTAEAGALREIKAGDLSGTNPTYTTLANNLPKSQYPGVAFASDGYLYMSLSGSTYSTLYKFNPTSGASVSSQEITSYGRFFADLGSCATPTVMDAVKKKVVDRKASGDQFTVSLSGNGVPATATATTTGTNTTVATDSVLVLPGLTYTVAEAASGTTTLSNYVSTYDCVNANTGLSFASGSATSATVTMPTTGSDGQGAYITCTFTNEVKNPQITLTKTATGTPTKAGNTISYSFTVANTGNRDLTAVALTDNLLTGVSCPATTLAVGKSMTCTANAYTVTQADVEAGKVVNTASVAASPPSGEGSAGSVTDSDKVTVTIAQTATLKIVKSLSSGNPFRAGDQLTYGFTITNTGNVAVTGVGVDDTLLTGEACAATTLAPGASTTCTAGAYTVTAADVTAGKVVNTAAPTGSSVSGSPSTDSDSTTTVTTKIGTPPAATGDTKTTKQNIATTVNPLANDTAGVSGTGTVGALDPTSVVLVAGSGDTVSNGGRKLVNSDGTYEVDAATGVVTFTPASNIARIAKAITYQVTDSTFGLTATSGIIITITPITPTAAADSATTAYRTRVTFGILGNDAAGDVSVPLVAASVVFTASGTDTLTTAQGTYSADDSGNVTFTPAAGFTGTTTAVPYSVADANGTVATANLTVTVAKPPAPSASDDSGSGLQGSPVTVTPVTNDTAGGKATLDATTVVLKKSDGSYAQTLVVAGKGTWTVNADGTVTFAPLPGFTGSVTAPYRIADELGQTATATVTVTITGVTPVAAADTNHAPYGTASVDTDVLANDTAGDGSVPLVKGSVVFSDGSTTLTNADGTYTVDTATGHIALASASGFTGTATPVTYRVADTNGTTTTATLTVTIGAPPSAAKDAATTPQNTPVTFDPLANDEAGTDGAGHSGTLVATSVGFTGAGVTDAGRTVVLAGKGTFSINATTGAITFAPDAGYTGTTPEVPYAVTDRFGNVAASTVKVTVTPIVPDAKDDTNHAPYGTASVATDVVANDVAGAVGVPLVPAGITFADGTTTLATVDGTWTIDAAHPGQISFAPASGFSGTASAVSYVVADTNGTTDTATLTVTIGQPPVASPDVASTPQDVDVTVDLLGNDAAGYDGTAAGGLGNQGTKLPASVVFTSSDATNAGRTLVVPGEGTYTIAPATGAVTFDPEPAFTGTATAVGYRFTDSFGNTAASTVTITVAAITPSADPDTTHTPYRTPVTTTVLANDSEGAASAPLQPGTVTLTTAGSTDAGKTLVVAGEGTWAVKADGAITFSPANGFSGVALVAYQVLDENGTPASATLTVTVGTPPTAADDSGTTPQNVDITLSVLYGDHAGDDGAGITGTLDPASVRFTAAAAMHGGRTLVTSEGTWTIDAAAGTVTFDPDTSWTGTTAAVGYEVTDSYGNPATAGIRVTVTPVVPLAHDDSASTAYRTPVTVPVLTNDLEGAASAPLDPTSVVITTTGADADGKGLENGDGTWSVNGTSGKVTFAPKEGFTGDAVITYRVADANGTTTSATVTVTVHSPAAPTAVDDTDATPYLTAVTTPVLANDTAGGLAALQTGSVVLTGAGASPDGRTLTNAEGTYTVNASGTVTFTPASGFSGTATAVTYQVSDELGQTGTATLTVTVGTPPAAVDNTATTLQGIPVTIAELGNDTPGTDGAGTSGTLTKTSVEFTSASATDGGRTLVVAGEGTWTIAANGQATFTPLPAFTGTTTAVGYRVTDSFGNTASAALTVTVTGVSPVLVADNGHEPYGTPVVVDVLDNDTPGDPAVPLDPTTVVITDPAAAVGGRTLVTDDGTWTVNATTGVITFTPADGFSGTPDPVTYAVSDDNGTTRTTTVTVSVGNPPEADNDSAVTPHDTTVTLSPLGNDTAGDDGDGVPGTLDKASVVFTPAAATDGDHTLVIAGQGTWTIDPATGTVSFDPLPSFTGASTSVQYQVTDSFGHDTTAYLTVTVGAASKAVDDSATTPQNVTVQIATPLANDTAGDDGAGVPGTLDPTSVVLTSADATHSGRTLVVDGEGTWTIDPVTGVPTFDPDADFVGTTTAVQYAVTDSHGTTAKASWTIVVTPITPTADDDTNHAPYGTLSVTTTVLDGDLPGAASAPLVPGSVVITTAGVSADGKTLVVDDEGTWTVHADGTITFAPETGFHGEATPVDYTVSDQNGTTASATLTVTIGEPPAATDDYPTTPQGVPVTFDPLANDLAGDDGTGTPGRGTLVPTTVVFTSPDATNGGRTLVIADKGTFTIDPVTGAVTFTPDATFEGTVPAVTYEVTDSFGNPTTAKIHVTVAEIIPTAANDTATTPANTPVTLTVLGNDTAGAASAPLSAGSVVITADGASANGKTLVTTQGTWKVNGSGTVTFTPADDFTGTTDPVQYRVADANGTPAVATMTVTVGGLPTALDDSGTTLQNVDITLCPLCNDTAGDDGAARRGTLDAGSLGFTSAAATHGGTTLVVAGEGTWTVNDDGTVTFDPEPAFTGVATPVDYEVTDSFGNSVSATITVTVTPVVPEAATDSGSGAYDTPVTINLLGNDVPGDDSAPLVASSVVFTSPDATDGGRTLVVAGEGTWRVNPDGSVTFTPVAGFTGTTTPVAYEVADTNGVVTTSTVTAVIAAGPAASADQVKGTEPDQPVVIDVIGNDTGGSGCTLLATSVVLLVGDPAREVTSLTVDGEGRWVAKSDGTLVFTPESGFHGWTSWVGYRVTDSCGNPTSAQARAWVPNAAASDSDSSSGSDSLAYTGAEVGGALGLGLALLVAGVALVAWRRRRTA